MSRKHTQSMQNNRQESHRVYLQQFITTSSSNDERGNSFISNSSNNSSNTKDNHLTLKTNSTAIRLTSTTNARDVCYLLRQKFSLPSLPQSSSSKLSSLSSLSSSSNNSNNNIGGSGHSNNTFSEKKVATLSQQQQPLVHRIHARLNQVRQQQQQQQQQNQSKKSNISTASNINDDRMKRKQMRQKRKQRKKKVLECQLHEDVLVMVATCFVPKSFVQFEHEEYVFSQQQQQQQYINNNTQASSSSIKPTNSSDSTNSSTTNTTTTTNNTNNNKKMIENNTSYQMEPLNIVETLLPSDIPLQRMDEILTYTDHVQENAEMEVFGKKMLTKKSRKTPLIHWFFIPKTTMTSGNTKNQMKPSVPKATINIDGYSTEAYDDSDYEDENDYDDNDQIKIQSSLSIKEDDDKTSPSGGNNISSSSWKREIMDYEASTTIHSNQSKSSSLQQKSNQSRLEKERHHFTILSTFESINGHDNTSGYLLKQSHKDKNVWKKVHCVLTENQFWFVSRVKKFGTNNSTRIGKHGIIDLNGTLLLESTMLLDSPLSGVPNTFQLTTREGDVHVFQAGSKSAYLKWSQYLSERIVLCQENSSFIITDSIIGNEVRSRQRRSESFLLPPLKCLSNKTNIVNNEQVNILMHIGLEIAAYKEQCRRVQYAHSSCIMTANVMQKRQQKIIEKPLWLNQSLENLTFAELLLTRCKDYTMMYNKRDKDENLSDDEDLHARSECVEKDIRECLDNLRKKNELYLMDYHQAMSDVSKDGEENHHHAILLPEALFDEMFQVFSDMLVS